MAAQGRAGVMQVREIAVEDKSGRTGPGAAVSRSPTPKERQGLPPLVAAKRVSVQV